MYVYSKEYYISPKGPFIAFHRDAESLSIVARSSNFGRFGNFAYLRFPFVNEVCARALLENINRRLLAQADDDRDANFIFITADRL